MEAVAKCRNASYRLSLFDAIGGLVGGLYFWSMSVQKGYCFHVDKRDLDSIWQPNKVWYQLIVDVLSQYGHSHQCDDCDWCANKFELKLQCWHIFVGLGVRRVL